MLAQSQRLPAEAVKRSGMIFAKFDELRHFCDTGRVIG
jgi:hypothetical protein